MRVSHTQADAIPEDTGTVGGDEYRSDSRPVTIAFVVAVILFLALSHRVFVYTPDDTFITFRYSRNLIDGFGPVFNPGAPSSDRTEGYSCPLFMFLMALLMKLPLSMDVLFRAKFLGLALGIGTLAITAKLSKFLRLPVWAQAALPIALASHSSFVVSSVNGMETMLMIFLVTLSAYLFVTDWWEDADTIQKRRPRVVSALAFAACALTRPEGILFGLMAVGLLVIAKRGRIGKQGLLWMAVFFAPVLAYLLWRHAFYGFWLPNTYYAKHIAPEEAAIKGAKYLLRAFSSSVTPFFLAVTVCWWMLVITGGVSERFQRAPASIVPLLVIAQIIFSLQSGGDGMGGWRFMAAVVPLMTLLSVCGSVEISDGLKKLKFSERALARAAGPMLCGAIVLVGIRSNSGYWQAAYWGYRSWSSIEFTLDQRKLMRGWLLESPVAMSDWLNTNVTPGSTIAYTEMGVTPYLCPKLRFLDVNGLTDRGVATLPNAAHAQNGVVDYYLTMNGAVGPYLVQERKPDYVMASLLLRPEEKPGEIFILGGSYRLAGTVQLPHPDPKHRAYLHLWKRNIQ